ncbi:FAD-dependent oxidoreductase [Stenotrophomonas maltophilia]|uniref:FAD-dependent oxidoreductase n=1 Tax=Stenotrophomonas maltophilia TaxID=40324 RepID=UPI000C25C5BD|nr:FAD-dependent oxidoreductase [Stenotrophomonas maltophilia]MBA0293265.1 FAD-dependent oxidoreductase [Stenotrophomonas maltophilia]MBA0349201.1 FAD-dependent oxidoreductase [Stenotrophomonas maltophilia]MBA0415331.1 FAD-dependent oxidoreductase [Stenotrophomonas maltophilia]MBH1371105.1 FAD-dependent oxidoreductase [Stenotrophomonas maltophilia]MBH1748788.1 FAD-dependent oxidoreductase [Stenotrophomonas maltophilia]
MSEPFPRASLWSADTESHCFRPLAGTTRADVLVVGAGMTGLLTAARLADSGLDVLVVDAGPIGGRNTVMSTGNLYAPVSRLAELVSRWGGDTASRIVQWRQQALRAIETLVHRYDLRCGFERVAMQYGMQERTREVTTRFERELHAYQRVGLQCEHQQSGLPFALGHAFRVPDQAQLDPAAFCRELARHLVGRVRIHDWTQINSIEASAGIATALGGRIHARHFVLATHSPAGFNLVQAEMEVYREYGVAVPVANPPAAGIHWIADRHRSLRGVRGTDGRDWLVLVGETHRTGETPVMDPAQHLVADARRNFTVQGEPLCWSAQQFRAADQLPYIGSSAHDNVWVATGYGPDGLTWAGVAARAITEGIIGTTSEIEKLLSPMRFTPVRSAAGWARTNGTVARHMVGDRLGAAPSHSPSELSRGCGALLDVNGKRTAVYRDEHGQLHAMSALCPHLKCVVQWNGHERTWDCPCHGSRFSATGALLEGPARQGLTPEPLQAEQPLQR